MNQMLVSGNSVRDAEVKSTGAEDVVIITVAESYPGKDEKETTAYWTVYVRGYLTEYARGVRKGDAVVAQGRLSEPACREGKDGRVFVNQGISVSDGNLHSFLKFKRKQREVVMNDME